MPSFDAGSVEARLTLDRSQFTKGIAEARRQAKTLDGKDISANLDLDKGKFEAELARVKQQLQALDRQTVDPKVTLDKGGLMTRRISLLKTALVGLAPAGIPILAGLTAATLGLAGALAGAAGGVGIFGLALGGNVLEAGKMSGEITKLNKQLEATEDIAKRSAIYDKLAKVWGKMDDSQKEFVTTLQNTKTVWGQFLDATRPDTLSLATTALGLIPDILSPLPAVVGDVRHVFSGWLGDLQAFFRGPGYAGFLDFVRDEGPPAMENLGDLVKNLVSGVSSLVKTFTPFGQDFLSVLVEGSDTFRTWARDLGSTGGFQSFMQYIAATGPAVVASLEALVSAGVHLVEALAPLGGPTLQVITALATGLAGIAEVAPGLLQFALIAGTVARGIGAISDAQVAIGKRTDRFKSVFAGAVGPMAKFKAGIGGAVGLLGGPWGLALAGATVALGYFATKHLEAQDRVKDLTAALKESSGAFDDNVRSVVAANLEQTGALKNADKLGISLDTVTDAVINQGGSLDTLKTRLQAVVDANTHWVSTGRGGAMVQNEQARAAEALIGALGGSNKELNNAVGAAERFEKASGKAKTSQDGLKFATQGAADAYDDQRKKIEGTIAALQASIDKQKEARNAALGLVDAQIGLEQAVDDAQKSAKDNGKTTDINIQKGRDNKEALIGVATAINEVVDSEKFRLQNAPAQLKILDTQRDRFIKIAGSMGVSKKAAKELADELIKTPKEISTEVKLKTDEAALEKVKADAKALDGKTVTTTAKFVTDNANIAAYQAALGGIPPDKPTTAKFATDNKNVAAYQAALGGIPPAKLTAATFSGNAGAIIQWKNDLAGIPDNTYSRGNFSSDIGAVRSYLGYLNSIDGKHVTATATTVRRVETIYERNQGPGAAGNGETGGVVGPDGRIARSYATGGVEPGYAPGVDSRWARVSPGEGILRPEVVRALGVGTVNAWNRAARRGEFGGDASNVQVKIPTRPQARGFVIENYHSTTVTQSSEDALMDTAQELSLMFGGV